MPDSLFTETLNDSRAWARRQTCIVWVMVSRGFSWLSLDIDYDKLVDWKLFESYVQLNKSLSCAILTILLHEYVYCSGLTIFWLYNILCNINKPMHTSILKTNETVGLGFGSQPGPLLAPPWCIWKCRETFLFITTAVGRKVLASSGWRPNVASNTLQSRPVHGKEVDWNIERVALRRVLLRCHIHHVHYFKVSVKSVPISGYYEITNFFMYSEPKLSQKTKKTKNKIAQTPSKIHPILFWFVN